LCDCWPLLEDPFEPGEPSANGTPFTLQGSTFTPLTMAVGGTTYSEFTVWGMNRWSTSVGHSKIRRARCRFQSATAMVRGSHSFVSSQRPAYWDEIVAYGRMPENTSATEKRIAARPSLEHSRDAFKSLLDNVRFAHCQANAGYIRALNLTLPPPDRTKRSVIASFDLFQRILGVCANVSS
jgi:hypothetical protein